MKKLYMDGSAWNTLDDLYHSFFEAVRAPDWHGKNLNAVRDSVGTGSINGIEVPYCLVIKNYSRIPEGMEQQAGYFIEVIRNLATEGIPVDIRLEA